MTAPSTQPAAPAQTHTDAFTAALVMVLLAASLILGGILSGFENPRAASDQNIYHLRVIEQFSRQLPHPDLSNYFAASGPLYPLLLAPVHRWVTQDDRALRAIGSVFTLALLGTLGWAVGRSTKWPVAVALCLPMATSLYVFASGVWLLPDNLAWLTVLAALLMAFNGIGRHSAGTWFALAALLLAAAVAVRQINLWPLGVLVAGAMLIEREPSRSLVPPVASGSWQIGMLTMLAGVPALVVLAGFYRMWGGLTPPAFQKVEGAVPPWHSGWQHEGPNFAVPTMVLAVLAATGFFFTGFLLPTLRNVFSTRGRGLAVLLLGMLVGAAVALVVPTNYDQPAGRYSGLWNVSARFPSLGQHSLLMIALAAAGGALVALWFLALGPRDRWIWLTAWACFIAAQTANAMAWHKYYEPFCLMMLPLAAARVVASGGTPRWAVAGPVLLAVLLAGVTLSTLTRG